jgi:hypothetical protein
VSYPVRSRHFSLLQKAHLDSDTHPSSNLTDTLTICPGIERPKPETDHLPSSSTEVKNKCCYSSTPHRNSTSAFICNSERLFNCLKPNSNYMYHVL